MLVTLIRKIKHILFILYIKSKRIERLVFNKPVIHVFGDSHSQLFQHESFVIHHIGPATAFKLSSDKSTIGAKKKIYSILRKIPQNKKNFFLFVFGEIDCRIHINKISKKLHIPLQKAVATTINSYGQFLQEIQNQYPTSTLLVLNVLPPGEQKNIYNVKYYPTREKHLEIVKIFNEHLQELCKKKKFLFISLFDELLDKKKNRIRKYVFDEVHYKKNILKFIFRELKTKHQLTTL